jgi:hypothetical protein
MERDEVRLDRDPTLGAWLARAEAPVADADVERLAARIAVAARREGDIDLRTRAARLARYVMPLAAAAGIAAALLLRTSQTDRDVSPDAAIAQAFSRSDAGAYLVDVAFAGYDEAWARQFTGGE